MELQLPENVKIAIDDIIKSEKYKSQPKVTVTQGSEAGEGYISKTYAVSIEGKFEKNIEFFVKCLPEMDVGEWRELFVQFFRTEFKFYNEVYPAFRAFQQKRNIKKSFDNVPQYYKSELVDYDEPPIILENLRTKGYTLRDRKIPVDDSHLKLPIEVFARYHAISYAMKDQDPKIYHDISSKIHDSGSYILEIFGMYDLITKYVRQFLDSLNPLSDKTLLDRCKNLSEVLIERVVNMFQKRHDYSVISQGDCWSNNMMFSYDADTGLPVDVKLIDWQIQRIVSPIIDFSYFFYTLATKEVLDNADFYLNLYYQTLSQRIKDLGSDPEKMYPAKVFLEQWRSFSIFGLFMAFQVIKIQLVDEQEIPQLEAGPDAFKSFGRVLKDQDKYVTRMKALVEYFIKNELL